MAKLALLDLCGVVLGKALGWFYADITYDVIETNTTQALQANAQRIYQLEKELAQCEVRRFSLLEEATVELLLKELQIKNQTQPSLPSGQSQPFGKQKQSLPGVRKIR